MTSSLKTPLKNNSSLSPLAPHCISHFPVSLVFTLFIISAYFLDLLLDCELQEIWDHPTLHPPITYYKA